MYKKLFVILAIIASFFLGKYLENMRMLNQFEDKDIHVERSWSWSLINPLLECELSTYGSNQKYIPFEDETKKKIQSDIVSKNSDIKISLYFRNLRNGPWFWLDEEKYFAPASLMKLPVAIAYMKWSEYVPDIRNSFLSWVIDTSDEQNIVPNQSVQQWSSYKIDDLIKYALIYSDNNANETLNRNLPKDIILKVFNDLNLPIIEQLEKWENDYISVKEYASFFRVLYNASYLSDTNSYYLLDILSHSAMTWAIRASIPADITVAHKFWERRIQNPDLTFTSQFHDCGIVYYPNYPYIICIMTKWWDDMKRLEWIVEKTSEIVFSEIKKRY